MKYYLPADKELNIPTLSKICSKFEGNDLPELRFNMGYYAGTGQKIMCKEPSDPSRPCNRIVKNYCLSIVNNFCGYLTGRPITYTSPDGDTQALQQVLDMNDVGNADSELLRQALIYGVSYELVYVNQHNDVRFKAICPENVIPIYSNDLDEDLLYAVYFTPIVDWESETSKGYSVDVYTPYEIYHYTADGTFTTFILDDVEPHFFGRVPLVVFELNTDRRSIFEPVIGLQDAYNTLLSDEVDDFESFVDSYMVLTNLTADANDIAEMKKSRTILLDSDSNVTYLTKDNSNQQVEDILSNLNSSIHTVSNSPDFSSEEFNSGVSSGIAIQFKLVGFDNIASNIEKQMSKALQQRIALINQILSLIDTAVVSVDINFTHNLPTPVSDTVSMVAGLRGLVSDSTLLAQIPFIEDVGTELAKLEAQDGITFDTYGHGDE